MTNNHQESNKFSWQPKEAIRKFLEEATDAERLLAATAWLRVAPFLHLQIMDSNNQLVAFEYWHSVGYALPADGTLPPWMLYNPEPGAKDADAAARTRFALYRVGAEVVNGTCP
jgi:hypothetical protein